MILYVLGVVAVSTLVYHLTEGWSLLDSLYFTITVMSSGYGSLTPNTEAGKLWTMAVTLLGAGAVGWLVLTAVEIGVRGGLREFLRDISQRRWLRTVRDHVVVCGFGRVGAQAAERLRAHGFDVVVIDTDEERVERARCEGFPTVEGNLTDRRTLERAGVDRARFVMVCTDSDETNVYVTLLVRKLNPDARVIAVARDPENADLLPHAGADEVVDAYRVAGEKAVERVLAEHSFTVTVRHDLDEVEKEWRAIVDNGGTILDVRFHVPESPEPIVKELPIESPEDLKRRKELLETSEKFRSMVEALHELCRGVHSHRVFVADPGDREKIVEELEELGFLIGVDMSHEEVLKQAFRD
ncbi:NAD-binding protein [Methanopyrus sp.]